MNAKLQLAVEHVRTRFSLSGILADPALHETLRLQHSTDLLKDEFVKKQNVSLLQLHAALAGEDLLISDDFQIAPGRKIPPWLSKYYAFCFNCDAEILHAGIYTIPGKCCF